MKNSLLHTLPLRGLVLLAVLHSGCTDSGDSAQPVPPSPNTSTSAFKQTSEHYTLRPTDVLQVEIFQEPEARFQVSISQEGDIVLPLVGKVNVAGLTQNQAQQKLLVAYETFYKKPQVTILITKYAERKVYVDGMVGRPGAVLFPPEEPMTIMRAITAAGGIAPRGERSDVTLSRVVDGRKTTTVIDTSEISSGKAPDIELKENDYIYVRDSHI